MFNAEPTQFDTDELKAVLEALRTGANLHEASERVAQIGYYCWNREEDCLESCSEQYARIFGLDAGQNYRTQQNAASLITTIHRKDRKRYLDACRQAHSIKHLDIEYRVVIPGGEVRYLREVSVYLDGDGQALKGDFGVVQDVSRRVQQRSELLQRNDLARQAEKLADIGYYVFDEQEQRYQYVSVGFARIHGTTVREYMKRRQSFEDDLDQIVTTDRERVAAAYQRYIESGEALDIEYRIVLPDGQKRWLRELNQARRMKDGRVRETLGVLQDITAQKAIELELLHKNSIATQAEAITDIGHFVFDEIADRYSHVSPGLARIYGVDTDFLMNRLQSTAHDLEFVHEDDRETVAALYDEEAEADEDGFDNWEIEYRMIRADGAIRWVREVGQTEVLEQGVNEQTIGVMIDITEQKAAEQKILKANEYLEQQVAERTRELAATVSQLQQEVTERKKVAAEMKFLANHDSLTEVSNLRLGRERLQQALTAARADDHSVVAMFMDLDGFKKINDEYGHEAGDKVLQIVAGRIKSQIRGQDTVARIGGDEFLLVLPGISEPAVAAKIATNVINNVGQEIALGSERVSVGVSIGIARYPQNGESVDDLLSAADKSMYRVKQRGKNDYELARFGNAPARVESVS